MNLKVYKASKIKIKMLQFIKRTKVKNTIFMMLFLLAACSSEPKSVEDYKAQVDAIMPILSKCNKAAIAFNQELWSGAFAKLSKKEIEKKQKNLNDLQAKCQLARKALNDLDKADYQRLLKDAKAAFKIDQLCEREYSKAAKSAQDYKHFLLKLQNEDLKRFLSCKNAKKVLKKLYKPDMHL